MGEPPANSPPQGPWLTYAQAAKYCGYNVAHLRNLVCAGEIPVYGPPRRRRFSTATLDAYMIDPDRAMRQFRKRKRPSSPRRRSANTSAKR